MTQQRSDLVFVQFQREILHRFLLVSELFRKILERNADRQMRRLRFVVRIDFYVGKTKRFFLSGGKNSVVLRFIRIVYGFG